jgi:menaquinol-cytochrome c reductase iron-sulfur subunit
LKRQDYSLDRREILKWSLRGIGLATIAMVGIPSLLASLNPILNTINNGNNWRNIGTLDKFPIGKMREIIINLPGDTFNRPLTEKAIYAWRTSESEIIAYSRRCTDLGCPLTYDPGSECFFCPCHGGIFNKNGSRIAGPPNRPMYRFKNIIVDKNILIDLNSVPPVA